MSPNTPQNPEPNILAFLSALSTDMQKIINDLQPDIETNKALKQVSIFVSELKDKVDKQKEFFASQKPQKSSYSRDKSLFDKVKDSIKNKT